MRSRLHGLLALLFPVEDDGWLTILRVGLGLQVTAYTLSARADWHELYSSNGQGLINREIAERLVITQRTVAAHVEHILEKLGFRSRLQIGLWAAHHALAMAGTS